MAIADVGGRSIQDLLSLRGRHAVVTGGARGIGLAIARRFAEAGADVALADLNEEAARGAARELASTHGKLAIGMGLDVCDGSSVAACAERAVREFGSLDIWVNNAGIYPTAPLLEMADSDWDRVLSINLRGTFIGAREAARRMLASAGGGVIINLASSAGYRAAGPGVAHYVASKHGVRGLTKSLAVELGPLGIRVLAIAPTLTATPGVDEMRSTWLASGLGDALERQAARIPLGRLGVADDVARVALFCASDLSAYMSGSTLLVDGGDLVH